MSQVYSLEEWRKKLADISTLKSQSKRNTKSDKTGPTPISEEEAEGMASIYMTVHMARVKPFKTKSDFARMMATEVALAACEGLISTRLNESQFSNVWMITAEGMKWLDEVEQCF